MQHDWDNQALTPVEPMPWPTASGGTGTLWLKRDDLYTVAGQRGGKARTCFLLAQRAVTEGVGLVTASSRHSPQCEIVAGIAHHLNIPARLHMPTGPVTAEMRYARRMGAEIVQHRPGHNSVIIARARADAFARGWVDIPFGMEHGWAITLTARQAGNVPLEVKRVVVPVGSGMTLAGVARGLYAEKMAGHRRSVPVVEGICVGANPDKRLARWLMGIAWQGWVRLYNATERYDRPVYAGIAGISLDPHYEAKVLPYLQPDDLFWIVGRRQTIG